MAKSKQQVRDFLNSQIGQSANPKCGNLQGQCPSLVKALFEQLGVPSPYVGRGNAKDCANNYVAQGIAKATDGWCRVCVNPNMGVVNGVRYGHIWIDIKDEFNIEQNGANALRVTKNTRPIGQATQIVSLDQWIDFSQGQGAVADNTRTPQKGTFKAYTAMKIRWGAGLNGKYSGVDLPAGETVKYDSYIDVDGIRWISYIGNSGNRCYIARRKLDNSVIYGEAY